MEKFTGLTEFIKTCVESYASARKSSKTLSLFSVATVGSMAFLLLRIGYKAIKGKLIKSPPQLYGLPIIGSLLTIKIWSEAFLSKMLPKYGDIVLYSVLGNNVCKVNDGNLVRKLYTKVFYKPRILLGFHRKGLGIEPTFSAVQEDEYLFMRRRKFMQSLSLVLNKFRKIYMSTHTYTYIYIYICFVDCILDLVLKKQFQMYYKI